MGSEMLAGGKAPATQVASTESAGPQSAAVGKQTREESVLERLGKKSAMQGIVSAAVGRAHTAYEIALTSLQMQRLVEKDGEMGTLALVAFLAGGKVLELALSVALRELMVAGAVTHELESAGVHVAEKEARTISHELGEKGLEAAIGVSVDLGKDKAKGPIAKAVGGNEKEVALEYIARLKDGAMVMFERLAEKVYELSDGELVKAKRALRAENIMPSMFEQQLDEKVKRFLETKVKDIGKRDGDAKGFVLEHKVGWVYGAGPRYLAYVDDAIDQVPNASPGPAYEDGAQLSLAEEGTWSQTQSNAPMGQQHVSGLANAHLADVKFIGRVEQEFVDAAVEQHQAKWLAAPRNYMLKGTREGRPHLEIL